MLKKLKRFFITFLFFFILSPAVYLYISITETEKRTDYPGRKIAEVVQKEWDRNFSNKIDLVAGNMWHGGNLAYHIKSKPKWDNILNEKKNINLDKEKGFVFIGDKDILLKICNGVFLEVEKKGICMIGIKK